MLAISIVVGAIVLGLAIAFAQLVDRRAPSFTSSEPDASEEHRFELEDVHSEDDPPSAR